MALVGASLTSQVIKLTLIYPKILTSCPYNCWPLLMRVSVYLFFNSVKFSLAWYVCFAYVLNLGLKAMFCCITAKCLKKYTSSYIKLVQNWLNPVVSSTTFVVICLFIPLPRSESTYVRYFCDLLQTGLWLRIVTP